MGESTGLIYRNQKTFGYSVPQPANNFFFWVLLHRLSSSNVVEFFSITFSTKVRINTLNIKSIHESNSFTKTQSIQVSHICTKHSTVKILHGNNYRPLSGAKFKFLKGILLKMTWLEELNSKGFHAFS